MLLLLVYSFMTILNILKNKLSAKHFDNHVDVLKQSTVTYKINSFYYDIW